MKLSSPQKEISASEARFRVVIAGRRFGKTYLSINEIAKFARIPNRKILYVAPTFGQAKQIVWNDLCDRLRRVKWTERINQGELSITLKNGSVIMLRSADNYDRMRGLGVDFVIFDEFADIAHETWTEVVRPALSDRGGHAMFIGTPKGMANWSRDLYEQGVDDDYPDWESFSYTTIQGGNVPEAEITAAKKDLDERTYRQEYEATFETYSGAIYYNFDRLEHANSQEVILDREALHIGGDFNVSPMSSAVGVLRKDGIHIVDEIVIYGSNTYEMAEEIKERYGKREIYFYPDASGGNNNTKGISDHRILQNAGFIVKAPRANPPVKDRIASVNAALKSANGTIKLRINKKCKKTIEALEKQTYKEDTRQPDKTSGLDHFNDSLGYLIHTLMPIKRDRVPSKNKYWGPM